MELVEVVLQGVRGAARPVRWVLPTAKGVSIIPAGEAEGLLARAVLELLAVQTDGLLMNAVLADADGQGRAAVVVTGRDQRRYRLLWDLHTGRRAIQLNTGTAWEMVTTTTTEIASTITARLGFPGGDALRDLFITTVDDLPSRRFETATSAKAGSGAAVQRDKPLPPGFGDAPAARGDTDKPLPPGFDGGAPRSRLVGRPEAELRARLAEIAAATGDTVDVGALEFELDGLQKKTFELQSQRKPVAEAEAALKTIDDQLARVAFLEAMPADFLPRARRLGEVKQEHERELIRLDDSTQAVVNATSHLSEEVSGLTRRGGPRPLQAATDDPLVRWGVVAGVAAIAVAGVGHYAADGLRWLALVDIPAFGVAVYGGIKLLGGLEEGASARMKLLRFAGERKRLVERFAIDRQQIERLLETHQLTFEQLPELEQQFALRADLLQRRTAHAVVLAEHDSTALAALDGELAGTAERIRVVEGELQNAGNGYDPTTAELRREADEIEAVLRGERQAEADDAPLASSAPAEISTASTSSAATSAAGPAVAVDVLRRQLRHASDLLFLSVEDTAAKLAPRAAQMIQALTDRRYVSLAFSLQGDSSVVDGVANQPMPFVQLPPGDRDLVALGLQLAIVEAAVAQAAVPVIFDRVLDHFPIEKAPLLVRALQFLGTTTQVICITQRRELAAAGTVVTAQQAAPNPGPA